jgi:hypothetical protein
MPKFTDVEYEFRYHRVISKVIKVPSFNASSLDEATKIAHRALESYLAKILEKLKDNPDQVVEVTRKQVGGKK